MQLVVLGKGDRKYEDFFNWAAQQYPGRMAVRLDYNEALSMSIYSGADLFLMPSKSEPCGLSQMIAMRYGTIPIVRETGGLKDTVQPYEAWRDAGNGFSFRNYASGDMLYVIREAVYLYKDYPEAFGRLRQRAMSCDFSWARSAHDYLRIYSNITGQPMPVAASEEAPAEAAPVEETPVEAAPVEAAPVEEAPAEAAPVKEAPAEATPAEEAPVEAAPAEAAPVKEAPAEATPAEEAPVEAVPEKKTRRTAAKKPAAKRTTTRKSTAKSTSEKTAAAKSKTSAATAEAAKSTAKKEKSTKKGSAAKPAKEDAAE